MKVQYGIITHPSADSKPVDRSVGICAAMKYLQARQKLSPEMFDEGLRGIQQQKNNNCATIVAPLPD